MYPKFVYVLSREWFVKQACTRIKLIRFVRFVSRVETQRTQSGKALLDWCCQKRRKDVEACLIEVSINQIDFTQLMNNSDS